jgi:hypothetical protein
MDVVGAAVCFVRLLVALLELELELGAGAAAASVEGVAGCATLEDVEVTGEEVTIAGGGIDDKVAASVVVDVNDLEVAVSAGFGALVAELVDVVVSSSESSSSLKPSTSLSMSSPSAAPSVDPRPVAVA